MDVTEAYLNPKDINIFCYYSIPLSRTHSGGVREIRWYYPVVGYPELVAGAPGQGSSESSGLMAQTPPTTISCRARERMEERLEVTLSGVAPSSAGKQRSVDKQMQIKTRAITPSNSQTAVETGTDGIVVGESELSSQLSGYILF